jgi:uncharacterized membrane protein YoaK (UPF0700 family)
MVGATTTRWRWQDHRAFLIGITAAAGWLDALSFLHLGKVFNSIMTGNVLFLGLGAGQGDGGLALRAGLSLAAFLCGSFVGARLIGRQLTGAGAAARLPHALMLEAVLLTAFAVIWVGIGGPAADHPAVRLVLLAVGALAMGVQAAIAIAAHVPNIATVALTATIAQRGAFAGWLGRESHVPDDVPSPALMAALVLTYFLAALLVSIAPDWPVLAFGPVLLLGAGVIGAPRSHPAVQPIG